MNWFAMQINWPSLELGISIMDWYLIRLGDEQ